MSICMRFCEFSKKCSDYDFSNITIKKKENYHPIKKIDLPVIYSVMFFTNVYHYSVDDWYIAYIQDNKMWSWGIKGQRANFKIIRLVVFVLTYSAMYDNNEQ